MPMFALPDRSVCFPQSVSLKHPDIWSMNWGSIVCIVTRQGIEQQELCNFWQGWGFFFSLKLFRVTGAHPTSYSVNLSLGVKWLRHDTKHFLPFSAEVENNWSYALILPYVLMVCITTSLPCTVSDSGLPIDWETKFHTHVKQQVKLLFCVLKWEMDIRHI